MRFTSLVLTAAAIGPAIGGEPVFRARVEQWGWQEVTLTSSRSYANPFSEVQLKCRFRSGQTEIVANGFYDGNNTWKVRLMPTVRGRWSFETISGDAQVNGKKGSFEVLPPGPGNHGPVVIRGKYHFAFADGTPYFPLGTTLYNWLHREQSLQLRTLATLKRSPFNKVRFCVFPKWFQFNRVEPPLYPYERLGEDKFDWDRFNPEYFRRIEARIRDLQALQIEADVILFHPYDRWGFAVMDRARDDAYLGYVIARLAAFRNVWWTMANEYDFFTARWVPIKEPKDWDHIFQMVRELDPYQHPRAIHNAGPWYDHSKPWVTHCNIQEQHKDWYQVALQSRTKYDKPILIDEYGYEGNNGNGWGSLSGFEEVNRHWALTMAGAYGSHGETYVHPGDLLWWSVGGELVGESPARLGFLKQVMTALPYEEMEPAPDLVQGGTALARRGSHYLFRFTRADKKNHAQIQIDGEGIFQVDMIDPWRMKVYPLGYTGAGRHVFLPHLVPGLLRIVKGERQPGGMPSGSIEELFAKFGSPENIRPGY